MLQTLEAWRYVLSKKSLLFQRSLEILTLPFWNEAMRISGLSLQSEVAEKVNFSFTEKIIINIFFFFLIENFKIYYRKFPNLFVFWFVIKFWVFAIAVSWFQILTRSRLESTFLSSTTPFFSIVCFLNKGTSKLVRQLWDQSYYLLIKKNETWQDKSEENKVSEFSNISTKCFLVSWLRNFS